MTDELLPEVCELHWHATTDALSTRLGHRYLRAFMSWFLKTENAIALVAQVESGTVVGYVIGAPVGYVSALNLDLMWVGVSSVLVRPWLLLDGRMRATLKARLGFVFGNSASNTSGLPAPVMSLVGIGVAPAAMGNGVGLALMNGFESQARAMHMASLRLSVYPQNTGARRLYERCGWGELPGPRSITGTMYYGRIIT